MTYFEDDLQHAGNLLKSRTKDKRRVTHVASFSNGNSNCGSGS